MHKKLIPSLYNKDLGYINEEKYYCIHWLELSKLIDKQ